MTAPVRLRGIVRTDLSCDVDRDVAAICQLAEDLDADLEPILVTATDDDYPLLFALLASTDVTAVAVPDTRHLSGWLPILRQQVEVWTLYPPQRVPGGRS